MAEIRSPLLVLNGGRGETPVPADALMQPGETIGIHRPDGSKLDAKVRAVVPPGAFIDHAIADQNGEARPLMTRKNTRRQIVYVIADGDGREFVVPHKQLAAARERADHAGLNGEPAQ